MKTSVDLDDLQAAYEWVSGGEDAGMDCTAYVDRRSGEIHWGGEGVDEAPPDDIEDGSLYVAVPNKRDLDLGRDVVFRFAETRLPAAYDQIRDIFRSRGAYGRFKDLLVRHRQLDAWHAFQQDALESALREWCDEHGLVLAKAPPRATSA
jgi:hypothetical protein